MCWVSEIPLRSLVFFTPNPTVDNISLYIKNSYLTFALLPFKWVVFPTFVTISFPQDEFLYWVMLNVSAGDRLIFSSMIGYLFVSTTIGCGSS